MREKVHLRSGRTSREAPALNRATAISLVLPEILLTLTIVFLGVALWLEWRAWRVESHAFSASVDGWQPLLITGIALTSALILVGLGTMIARSLKHAVAIAGAIADGKLNNEINIRGTGALAQLLDSLMAIQQSIADRKQETKIDREKSIALNSKLHFSVLDLQQRETELQDYRDNLEAMIATRTAELAESNEQLSREVSRHRQTQQHLLTAKDVAEKANAAKSQFLANVSHEIRTPMIGISGMVDLLSRTELTQQQGHFAHVIKDSAASLLQVINEILDFSKIEAGQMSLSLGNVDLRACIKEIEQLLGESARKKGLKLLTEVSADIPRFVFADGARIRQIVLNLAGNAIKFTDAGAVVIRVLPRESGDDLIALSITVEDTGIGIPGEALENIFNPFQQVDGAMSRKVEGTGLGLAIVRELVEMMGGRIGVESKVGRGSVFRVQLSLKQADASKPIPITRDIREEHPPHALELRVLLAEDHPVNQEIIHEYLMSFGCSVEIVGSGKEALAAFNPGKFDLVLMDCQMPEMDGLEATRLIRMKESAIFSDHKKVPIVALTAHAMPDDRERCIAAGMNDYLTKPFEVGDLYRIIGRWGPARAAPRQESTKRSPTEPREPPGNAPDAALETSVVQSLKRGFNPAGRNLLNRVGQLYLDITPKEIREIETAIDAGNMTAVQSIAHKAKSASANIGAQALSKLFKELEACAGSKKLAEGRDVLRHIEIEFDRVAAALNREMSLV